MKKNDLLSMISWQAKVLIGDIFGVTPLRQTPEVHFRSVGGESTTSKIPRISKNPKNPTQGSTFWKLEREPQNPKTEQILRISKIPKKSPKDWIFGNSSGSLKIINLWYYF